MPDTKPLPAAELLALADRIVEVIAAHDIESLDCDRRGDEHCECLRNAAEAYRAARAASTRTLEEELITDFVSAPKDHNGSSSKFCGALQRLEAHGRVLNSRMLAGEGNTAAPAPGEEGGGQ